MTPSPSPKVRFALAEFPASASCTPTLTFVMLEVLAERNGVRVLGARKIDASAGLFAAIPDGSDSEGGRHIRAGEVNAVLLGPKPSEQPFQWSSRRR